MNVEEKYWLQVVKKGPAECWDWDGYKDRGYGRIYHDYKCYKAHRVSYQIHFGPIQKGMNVCHRCDNPSCTNPNHLFLGTLGDNYRDSRSKNRHAHGERHGNSKLTLTDVLCILKLRHDGKVPIRRIARRMQVVQHTVKRILNGTGWARELEKIWPGKK